MKLSLVIPCFNEGPTLTRLAARCVEVLKRRPGSEVILVDNGSTDDSPAVLRGLVNEPLGLRSVQVPINRGYGHGIRAGLAAATGEILGWTHADLQTDPLDALAGVELFVAGGDPKRIYAKGRRYGRPFTDRLFTAAMSAFETMLLRVPLSDINAQPNLFHRSFYETWRNAPDDFSLDLYAYYEARRRGLVIRRFPVRFGIRAHGASHWNVNWRGRMRFIRRTVGFSLKLKSGLASPGHGR